MSDLLDALVKEWFTEKEVFTIAAKRFQDCVSNLSSLNSKIYHECQRIGVDIDTLNLSGRNDKEAEKQPEKKVSRVKIKDKAFKHPSEKAVILWNTDHLQNQIEIIDKEDGYEFIFPVLNKSYTVMFEKYRELIREDKDITKYLLEQFKTI